MLGILTLLCLIIEHITTNGTFNLCDPSKTNSTCEMNKGAVFIKEKEIIATTDSWTIVVTIGTEDYDRIITQVEAIFIYLEGQQNVTELKDLIPSFELTRLRASLNVICQQVTTSNVYSP